MCEDDDNLSRFAMFVTPIFSALQSNLSALVAVYLCFALSLSVSCTAATFIVDIVSVILLSVLVLRIVELCQSVFVFSNLNLQLCMEVSSVALLLPSVGLELISIGFRSFSLGFRIFANVSAGHVLSDIVLVARYSALSTITVALQLVFSFLLVAYELLVATIQLGVFISLVSVYVA